MLFIEIKITFSPGTAILCVGGLNLHKGVLMLHQRWWCTRGLNLYKWVRGVDVIPTLVVHQRSQPSHVGGAYIYYLWFCKLCIAKCNNDHTAIPKKSKSAPKKRC